MSKICCSSKLHTEGFVVFPQNTAAHKPRALAAVLALVSNTRVNNKMINAPARKEERENASTDIL